jgi:ComEC/Rec2-related protein
MLAFLRRAPLVLICLFFVSGIILSFEFEFHSITLSYPFFLLLAIAIGLNLKRKFPFIQTAVILILSFLFGIITVLKFKSRSFDLPKGEVQVEFYIEKKLRSNQYIGTFAEHYFLVEIENNDSLNPSDELLVIGEFQEIQPPKLPWLFNQKKQMLSNGITHKLQVSKVISAAELQDTPIQFLPQKIQSRLQEKITSAIPDSSAAAILSALLLGETSLLSKDMTADYSVAGVVHILAVSGMHVALIYELILFILKLAFRKKRKWLTFFLAMSLLWGYGAITGFSASVVRACCMFSFFVLSDCFLLSRNTGNTIAGSTLLILYFQPFLIFNLGFLLSLSAVLGIVVIHPLIMRVCYTENKISHYLISSTSITLSATLTTLPITLYIFHSFPTYFIIANLILVPWSTLIMYLGIAFMFLSEIPILGNCIIFLLNATTTSMNQFIHLIHLLPNAQISTINFNIGQLIFAYLIILSIILFVFFNWKHTLHLSGISLLLFIFSSYEPPTKSSILFTYYQSNLLLIANEKEMILACDNDTITQKYLTKLSLWKCQQNRASQNIRTVPFPTYFELNEAGKTTRIGTIHTSQKRDLLLLNDALKKQVIDSNFAIELQNEKILLGKGVSKKKREKIQSFLKEQNISFQDIQSHPFILK